VNPWLVESIVIASIDLVKRPEVAAALADVPIDLLIADEAHHLIPGTDRGRAVSQLASRAPWCVMVSATPHSGDANAFDYLCGAGSSGDRIAIFRRRRTDVGLESRRRTHLLRINPTPPERTLLSAIHEYAHAIWRGRGQHDAAVQLVAITLERRAASSREAITRTLRRRLELLSQAEISIAQPTLPGMEDDVADDVEGDAVLAMAGLDDGRAECAAIAALIDLADACRASAKLRHIERLLRRVREPAIIFTEYRDTLEAAVAAFASSHRTGAIHGGLPPDVRRSIVDAFNDGCLDLLVATDTAGEGLNLHRRCRLVIDLELPWNPMRLEQRIGRVDRLGQRRTVHAIHLCHRDSIEERVFGHLERRQRVADAIFDGTPVPLDGDIAIDSAAITAGAPEAARLERIRHAVGMWPEPIWARPRRRARFYVIVRRITHVNGSGLAVAEQLCASRVELSCIPRTDREWRYALEQASRRAVLPASLDCDSAATLRARIQSMKHQLTARTAVLYQRSLFDPRSDLVADARKARVATLTAAFDRALQRVGAPTSVRVDLVAAWPERPA
jgi:hypothetical protein